VIATVMLLAAVMVSLTFGVLTAYAICYGILRMFHRHSKAVVKASAVSVLAER
jgi:hypothetical protein